MNMELVCKKCDRKFKPIFENHIYNGSESILHGNESIKTGNENISRGQEKTIYDFKCPYCGTYYKKGFIKK